MFETCLRFLDNPNGKINAGEWRRLEADEAKLRCESKPDKHSAGKTLGPLHMLHGKGCIYQLAGNRQYELTLTTSILAHIAGSPQRNAYSTAFGPDPVYETFRIDPGFCPAFRESRQASGLQIQTATADAVRPHLHALSAFSAIIAIQLHHFASPSSPNNPMRNR